MKYNLKRITFVCICLMCGMAGWAQGAIITAPSVGSYIQVGGIAYMVTSDDPKTVAVTYKYNSLQQLNVQQTYTGSVVIPETIIVSAGSSSWTYTVTGIDDDAFQYGSGMTELTIPASITKISSSAFTNATGLKKLTFLEGNPISLEWYYGTIGFDNCPIEELYLYRQLNATKKYPHFKHAKTIRFGSRVTRIESEMFYGDTALERLVVPGSVSSIGQYAFKNCTNLKVVKFEYGPEKLSMTSDNTYPERNSFNYTSLDSLFIDRDLSISAPISGHSSAIAKVKHLVVGDKVTEISEGLFRGSDVLETAYIGKGVESIGEAAFIGCSNLRCIILDCPIEEINSDVFAGCGFDTITIPNTVKSISSRAFQGSKLSKLIIPSNVTSIGPHALRSCDNLRVLILEDGEEDLSFSWGSNTDNSTFYNPPLDSLYLGRNIKSSDATYNQLSPFGQVNTIRISDTVNNIPDKLFHNCSNLKTVEVSWQNPIIINRNVFENYYNYSEYANATLLVPGGTVKNYQATSAWNEFANIVPTSIGVTMTAGEGGCIRLDDEAVSNGSKLLQVKPNSVLTFEITPEETHFLTSVTVNDEDVTAQVVNGQLTPLDLSEDLEIVATFTAKPFYSVTATASAGGTAVVTAASVMWGNGITVTLTPNEGYELKSVTVNDVDKTGKVVDGVLTLSNVQENKTVVATFQKLRYTITAAECEHGSISLSANEVEWDASATATFTPAAHYEVATVSVNGDDRTAQLSNNKLTIANIRQAITVGATFRLQSFSVTETHNAGGNVSLSAGTAQWGSTVTVTIAPDDEHLVKRVTVNSVDVTDDVADNEYTVTVEGATAIAVTFESKPYFSVTATATAGGTATVGSASVMWGRSTTVTLTPDECHELKGITVNGEDRTDEVVDDVLTLSDIRENTAVVATFGIITETITMATSSGAPREMKGYSSDRGLDFTHVADVKAYIASFFTKEHTTYLTRIYVVPPHTGIVLKTDNPGVTVDVPTTNEDVYIANLLMPAVENVTVKPTETIDGVDYRNLMVGMLNGTSTMGFVEFSSQVVRSNNCYLRVPVSFYNSAASARSVGGLNMVFDDEVEATGIQAIEEYQNEETGNTYDLGGRKVNNSRKGLVIKNGKLIYVKP